MSSVIRDLWYLDFSLASMLGKLYAFGGLRGDDIENIWERRNDVYVMDLVTREWHKNHKSLEQRRAGHRALVHGSSFIQVGGNSWLEKAGVLKILFVQSFVIFMNT